MNKNDDIRRKTFFYSASKDEDIELWFNSLPPRGQTEKIINAIRYYINNQSNLNNETNIGTDSVDILAIKREMEKEMEQLKKRIKALEDKSNISSNTTTNNDRYVDGTEILKNLGKLEK